MNHWTVAPPLSQGLNLSHPLCHGLVAFVRPNSYLPRNLIGEGTFGKVWTAVFSGNGFGGQTPLGEGWGQLSQNGALTLPADSLPALSNFSIAWYGMALSFPTSYPYISEMTPENNGTTAFLRFGDAGLAADKVQFAGNVAINGNTALATHKAVLAVITFTTATQYLYVNGLLDASGSSSLSPIAPGIGFGYSNFGARGLNGWHAYMAVWNRILSPTEINTLSFNPWAVFQQSSRVLAELPRAGRWGISISTGTAY